MDAARKTRLCYYLAAVAVVVLLLIIFYTWHEYAVKNTEKSGMMNTHHWDQTGTYQHTADTWGLPVHTSGDSRVNYSGFSKENMSVGAHWDTDGTYGHTPDTLPS